MNYPDDVRQYDNDPRSPFYGDAYERQKEYVMERAQAIAREMVKPDGYLEGTCKWGMGDVIDHIFSNLDDAARFEILLASVVESQHTDSDSARLDGFLLEHAEAVAEDIAWREIE